MSDATIEVSVGTKKYSIAFESLSGRDVRDFRQEVGMSPRQALADQAALDIDIVAGFVWLARRRTEPVTFEQVLDSIDYSNLSVDTGTAGDDSPEA